MALWHPFKRFRFWQNEREVPKVTPQQKHNPNATAVYGGMGERELQLRLELLVEDQLSSRRSVIEPARQLIGFNLVEQERFLSSVAKLTSVDSELAYNFCHFAPESLQRIDEDDWPSWLDKIIEVYNTSGLDQADALMLNVDGYLRSIAHAPSSVALEEIIRVLEGFIVGLNGRSLKLAANEQIYTDTETLHLPERLSVFDSRDDNFQLYKAIAVHLWAQTWFGTWRLNVGQLCREYADSERALRLFNLLEILRLDACIKRELPGVHRSMNSLGQIMDIAGLSDAWKQAAKRLQTAGATVQDSAALLSDLYARDTEPEPPGMRGELLPGLAEQIILRRADKDKTDLADALNEYMRELKEKNSANDDAEQPPELTAQEVPDAERPDGYRIELEADGHPVETPDNIRELLDSIQQDLGEIPNDYLNFDGDDDFDGETPNSPAEDPEASLEADYRYDEWDHSRGKYRKEWCHLSEHTVQPVYDDFVSKTLDKHRGMLKHLNRTFEALREDDKRLKRQPDGDDIDIDAVVDSFPDIRLGNEVSNRLFTRSRKVDRNIAVMFMIDMSGSTSGWINEMEREALVLLSESLEILGDRYAIYGFSGRTHKRCDLYHIKRFDEAYNEEIRARISGIKPQDYTRMGVAIRHLTQLLHEVETRTKLLITLSDGRPDDQDGYRGPYGIEDTRKALVEARFLGIHPYCITIDEKGMEYLEHMYGAASFTVVNDIGRLPFKVSDIYRRITM